MHNSHLENSKCEDIELQERASLYGHWRHWEIVRSEFSNRKLVGLTNNLSVQILDLPGTNLG